jgi:MoaD family protein
MTTGKIEIMFHATFREITKNRTIIEEINEGCTVASIIAELAKRYGQDFKEVIDKKTGKITNDILVILNGKNIRAIDEKLKDNDVLIFTLPLGGG